MNITVSMEQVSSLKKRYQKPSVNVSVLEAQDVITMSGVLQYKWGGSDFEENRNNTWWGD